MIGIQTVLALYQAGCKQPVKNRDKLGLRREKALSSDEGSNEYCSVVIKLYIFDTFEIKTRNRE
jgi:hypothetical protein